MRLYLISNVEFYRAISAPSQPVRLDVYRLDVWLLQKNSRCAEPNKAAIRTDATD